MHNIDQWQYWGCEQDNRRWPALRGESYMGMDTFSGELAKYSTEILASVRIYEIRQ